MNRKNQIWYKSHFTLLFYGGIDTTISFSIDLPDKQFNAYIRENYPEIVFLHPIKSVIYEM